MLSGAVWFPSLRSDSDGLQIIEARLMKSTFKAIGSSLAQLVDFFTPGVLLTGVIVIGVLAFNHSIQENSPDKRLIELCSKVEALDDPELKATCKAREF